MKNIYLIGFFTLLLLITGCAPSIMVAKDYQRGASDIFNYNISVKDSVVVSEEAITIMKSRLESELSKRNMLASTGNKNIKRIEIKFNNYNMRNGGARFFGGIFAGEDVIDTLVLVKGGAGNENLAEYTVVSTNNSGWGTSSGLIEGHADKIVQYLVDGSK